MARQGKCAGAAKHRTAQNKYVAKNPGAQRARVKQHYQKNRGKILADKKKARGGGRPKPGGKIGRPREC